MPDTFSTIDALIERAFQNQEEGQTDDALASYQDALRRTDELGQAGLQAQVRRYYGLFLADMGKQQEAEAQLRLAVKGAALAIDVELLGRCQVALGVFLQHSGQREEAEQRLGEALRLLDTTHPDVVSIKYHLHTLGSGGTCGCGNQGEALANVISNFVIPKLPAGLLEELQAEFKYGRFALKVKLARDANEEETHCLDQVIQQCLAELQMGLVDWISAPPTRESRSS
jgi:tetratricopeptide (TPR) repeat protein